MLHFRTDSLLYDAQDLFMGWLLGSGGRRDFKAHPAIVGLYLQGGIPQEISSCTISDFVFGLSQDLRIHYSTLAEEVEGPWNWVLHYNLIIKHRY